MKSYQVWNSDRVNYIKEKKLLMALVHELEIAGS